MTYCILPYDLFFTVKPQFAVMFAGSRVSRYEPNERDKTLTILEHSQPPMSAGDSGYQRIRSDIIFGVLTPSGRLKLDSMKEDYGVSVSTLREILNRLASEGFVVAEGQRGFEVAPVSIQNLRELAQLRILLEHHAMTESFRAGDMEWEGRVVSAHHKLAATERAILSEGDDPELRKRYDGEFHQASKSILTDHINGCVAHALSIGTLK